MTADSNSMCEGTASSCLRRNADSCPELALQCAPFTRNHPNSQFLVCTNPATTIPLSPGIEDADGPSSFVRKVCEAQFYAHVPAVRIGVPVALVSIVGADFAIGPVENCLLDADGARVVRVVLVVFRVGRVLLICIAGAEFPLESIGCRHLDGSADHHCAQGVAQRAFNGIRERIGHIEGPWLSSAVEPFVQSGFVHLPIRVEAGYGAEDF